MRGYPVSNLIPDEQRIVWPGISTKRTQYGYVCPQMHITEVMQTGEYKQIINCNRCSMPTELLYTGSMGMKGHGTMQ